MNKSIVIIICAAWVICTVYLVMASANNYPYRSVAMAGTWITSFLMLGCIIMFARKN